MQAELPAEINPKEVAEAADRSAQYLASQIDMTGRFNYRFNLDPAVRLKNKYNWLRHCGAIYSLADYANKNQTEQLVPSLEKALSYLRRSVLRPVPGMHGALAVWTDDEKPDSTELPSAKLGGAGLALVAMSSVNNLTANTVPVGELRGLGAFILGMQNSDGSFHSKFIPSQGGPSADWVSLYYPGEAALGLIMLFEQDRDGNWLEAAQRGLLRLAKDREGQTEVPPDHWALIATARIWPFLGQADRAILTRHARQILNFMLDEQIWLHNAARGGFVGDGRTTPTATRLEGILATEFLFRSQPDFHRSLNISATWGLKLLLHAQFKTGPHAGAITRAIARIVTDHPEAEKFNARATEVRIDYVQHALSAWLQYLRYIGRENLG